MPSTKYWLEPEFEPIVTPVGRKCVKYLGCSVALVVRVPALPAASRQQVLSTLFLNEKELGGILPRAKELDLTNLAQRINKHQQH